MRPCRIHSHSTWTRSSGQGQNRFAPEALAGFKEYWANPSYGEKSDPGIYSAFRVGDLDVFLIGGRFHSRQMSKQPTMLGPVQFEWLWDGLRRSRTRYKLLVSGIPFAGTKRDHWGSKFFRAERRRLFQFIVEHQIAGVVAVSGDVHSTDIHKISIGRDRYLYDFRSSPLAQTARRPPVFRDKDLLFSHGERNQFAELDFHPASDSQTAITFRAFAGTGRLVHEFKLAPGDIGL